MKLIKDTVGLSWGIIRFPANTFDRIKKEKPFSIGITIWLFSYFLYFIWMYIAFRKFGLFDFTNVLSWIFYSLREFSVIFIYAFFLNLIAVKLYKCENNYSNIILCLFFINVTMMIKACLAIFFTLVSLIDIINFLHIVFILWGIGLSIIAIKRVYRVSGGMLFIIWILGGLISTLLFQLFKYLLEIVT